MKQVPEKGDYLEQTMTDFATDSDDDDYIPESLRSFVASVQQQQASVLSQISNEMSGELTKKSINDDDGSPLIDLAPPLRKHSLPKKSTVSKKKMQVAPMPSKTDEASEKPSSIAKKHKKIVSNNASHLRRLLNSSSAKIKQQSRNQSSLPLSGQSDFSTFRAQNKHVEPAARSQPSRSEGASKADSFAKKPQVGLSSTSTDNSIQRNLSMPPQAKPPTTPASIGAVECPVTEKTKTHIICTSSASDHEYVPESLRSLFEQADQALRETQQEFIAVADGSLSSWKPKELPLDEDEADDAMKDDVNHRAVSQSDESMAHVSWDVDLVLDTVEPGEVEAELVPQSFKVEAPSKDEAIEPCMLTAIPETKSPSFLPNRATDSLILPHDNRNDNMSNLALTRPVISNEGNDSEQFVPVCYSTKESPCFSPTEPHVSAPMPAHSVDGSPQKERSASDVVVFVQESCSARKTEDNAEVILCPLEQVSSTLVGGDAPFQSTVVSSSSSYQSAHSQKSETAPRDVMRDENDTQGIPRETVGVPLPPSGDNATENLSRTFPSNQEATRFKANFVSRSLLSFVQLADRTLSQHPDELFCCGAQEVGTAASHDLNDTFRAESPTVCSGKPAQASESNEPDHAIFILIASKSDSAPADIVTTDPIESILKHGACSTSIDGREDVLACVSKAQHNAALSSDCRSLCDDGPAVVVSIEANNPTGACEDEDSGVLDVKEATKEAFEVILSATTFPCEQPKSEARANHMETPHDSDHRGACDPHSNPEPMDVVFEAVHGIDEVSGIQEVPHLVNSESPETSIRFGTCEGFDAVIECTVDQLSSIGGFSQDALSVERNSRAEKLEALDSSFNQEKEDVMYLLEPSEVEEQSPQKPEVGSLDSSKEWITDTSSPPMHEIFTEMQIEESVPCNTVEQGQTMNKMSLGHLDQDTVPDSATPAADTFTPTATDDNMCSESDSRQLDFREVANLVSDEVPFKSSVQNENAGDDTQAGGDSESVYLAVDVALVEGITDPERLTVATQALSPTNGHRGIDNEHPGQLSEDPDAQPVLFCQVPIGTNASEGETGIECDGSDSKLEILKRQDDDLVTDVHEGTWASEGSLAPTQGPLVDVVCLCFLELESPYAAQPKISASLEPPEEVLKLNRSHSASSRGNLDLHLSPEPIVDLMESSPIVMKASQQGSTKSLGNLAGCSFEVTADTTLSSIETTRDLNRHASHRLSCESAVLTGPVRQTENDLLLVRGAPRAPNEVEVEVEAVTLAEEVPVHEKTTVDWICEDEDPGNSPKESRVLPAADVITRIPVTESAHKEDGVDHKFVNLSVHSGRKAEALMQGRKRENVMQRKSLSATRRSLHSTLSSLQTTLSRVKSLQQKSLVSCDSKSSESSSVTSSHRGNSDVKEQQINRADSNDSRDDPSLNTIKATTLSSPLKSKATTQQGPRSDEARAKAIERIREHKLKEKLTGQENVGKALAQTATKSKYSPQEGVARAIQRMKEFRRAELVQAKKENTNKVITKPKYSVEDGVARAKQRLLQFQRKEAKEREKSIEGKLQQTRKVVIPRRVAPKYKRTTTQMVNRNDAVPSSLSTVSSVTRSSRITAPRAPVLASARRHGEKARLDEKPTTRYPEITLANSMHHLKRVLRDDSVSLDLRPSKTFPPNMRSSPSMKTSSPPDLATTKRLGVKPSPISMAANRGVEVTLAGSTQVLQRMLRSNEPCFTHTGLWKWYARPLPPRRHSLKRSGVT